MTSCSARGRTNVGFTKARSPTLVWGPVLRATWPLLAASTSLGCKCEGNSQRPFTPFGIATEVGASVTSGAPDTVIGSSDENTGVVHVTALDVNPPASGVEVDDQRFGAPSGFLIAQYLAADFDGKPGREVVARVVGGVGGNPTNPTLTEQSLVLLSPNSPAKPLLTYPTFVPRNAECSQHSALHGTGTKTLTWDVRADCPPGSLIARSPQRSVAVIAPHSSHPVRLHLRLSEPASGEHLEVDVDTRDRDGDEHDDATLTFRLWADPTPAGADAAVKPAQPAEARLVWLDRAAGMARDNSEPRRSFAELGSLETVRAKGPNTSRQVPQRIQFARRLYAYLCKEAATFRVTDVDGAAISCGELTSVFDSWATADVAALLTQNHYSRALLAHEQASWFGGGISSKVEAAIQKSLRGALTERAVSTRRLEVGVVSTPPVPHYSPLRFVERALLIQTPQGVQRWQDDLLADASDEVDPWPLIAFGPEGQRLSQLAFPCNEATLFGSSQSNTGAFGTALPTNLLSPRPGLCESNASTPDIDFRPVAWSLQGLSAYIGPVAVGLAPTFRQPGSPQSANGAYVITSGKLGLVVQSSKGAELWTPSPAIEAPSDCVIADSGAVAACLDGKDVLVLRAPGAQQQP